MYTNTYWYILFVTGSNVWDSSLLTMPFLHARSSWFLPVVSVEMYQFCLFVYVWGQLYFFAGRQIWSVSISTFSFWRNLSAEFVAGRQSWKVSLLICFFTLMPDEICTRGNSEQSQCRRFYFGALGQLEFLHPDVWLKYAFTLHLKMFQCARICFWIDLG